MSDERDLQRREKDRRTYRLAGMGSRSFTSIADDIGHVDDLVAGYVLGALEADEAAAVDAHVRTCPSCEAFSCRRAAHREHASLCRSHARSRRSTARWRCSLVWRMRSGRPRRRHCRCMARKLGARQRFPAPRPCPGIRWFRQFIVLTSRRSNLTRVPTSWLVSVMSVPLLIALVATGFWGLQLQNQLSSQNAQLTELQSELANFGSGTTSYPLPPGFDAPQAEGQIVIGSDGRADALQIDVNSKDAAGAYELWVNQDGKLVPAAEFTVDQDGIGQARFELDQPFGEYESVHIRAKALDPSQAGIQSDTLVRDSGGALGSTGSGLEISIP